MDLQNAFYVIGIVTLSLMLIIMIAIVIAVFVIRAKVTAIQDSISQKLNIFGNIADKSHDTVEKVKKIVRHKR